MRVRRTRWRGGALLSVAAAALLAGARANVEQAPLAPAPPAGVTPVAARSWALAPAGEQVPVGAMPLGAALSPDGRTLAVSSAGGPSPSLQLLDVASRRVVDTAAVPAREALSCGVAWSPNGRVLYAAGGAGGRVWAFRCAGRKLRPVGSARLAARPGASYPAGLAVSPDGRRLYAAEMLADRVTVLDAATLAPVARVKAGARPYALALTRDGSRLYVADWEERKVATVDTRTLEVSGSTQVGEHPAALALKPDGTELYVANEGEDTISVIDTASGRVTRVVDLEPYAGAPYASQPDALAVSPDGRWLYAANAGNNDVAVISLAAGRNGSPGPDSVAGLIPTAWYPTALAVSPAGGHLYVVSARGAGTPSPTAANSSAISPRQGSVAILPRPGEAALRRCTRQVIEANGFDERLNAPVGAQAASPAPVPRRAGEPSLFRHVICVLPAGDPSVRVDWKCDTGRAPRRAGIASPLPVSTLAGLSELARCQGRSRARGEIAPAAGPDAGRAPVLRPGAASGNAAPETVADWLARFRQVEQTDSLPALTLLHLPRAASGGPGLDAPGKGSDLRRVLDALRASRYRSDTALFLLGPTLASPAQSMAVTHRTALPPGPSDDTASALRTIELILALPPISPLDAAAPPMVDSLGE